MSKSLYAISDVHGHLDALHAALKLIDLDNDSDANLILLGDYVDRGPNSRAVLELIRDIQQRHPDRVIALLGNHDQWLLEWLDGDNDDATWLIADTELVTTRSFVPHTFLESIPVRANRVEINATIKHELLSRHEALITWLRTLPLWYETAEQIFVHAGVDELAGAFWKAGTPDYVFTHKYPASRGSFLKTILAGHVRTAELHGDGSHGVYYDGASHFYIDGSVEITGRLNVLRYDVESGEYSERSAGSSNGAEATGATAWSTVRPQTRIP